MLPGLVDRGDCCVKPLLKTASLGGNGQAKNGRMSLLKESEQQHAFRNDDDLKVDRAREEAEALFRKTTEPALKLSPTDPPARKPRILSVTAPPLRHEIAKAPIGSEPQLAASVAHGNRETLNQARAAIFRQQYELRTKLEVIDNEMRAIDAYEAVKSGKIGRSRYGRKK